jgi:YjjG family noncanonical pyrimidine nucleotidase
MDIRQKRYKCIFFDLDHTLWDYETSARQTLAELFHSFDLRARGVTDADSLYQQFRKVNFALWDLYDRDLITQDVIRKERFKQILEFFNAYEPELSESLSREYLEACPRKGNLIPHAAVVLDYLSAHYKLTIVTNGFEEIQHVKLCSGNLLNYFDHIVTSQKAGHRKPSQKIFEYAMNINGIKCCDAIMVGDNLITDIGGARGASIDTIYFNPEKLSHQSKTDHEISCLSELKNIL